MTLYVLTGGKESEQAVEACQQSGINIAIQTDPNNTIVESLYRFDGVTQLPALFLNGIMWVGIKAVKRAVRSK